MMRKRCVATVVSALALGWCSLAYPADDAKRAAPPPAAANPAPASPAAAMPSVPEPPTASTTTGTETGLAAVYSDRLNGHKTASGARYDRNLLTAAHKTLPFGTRVKVTNNRNHKSVTVTINDRGPAQAGRILDLSPRAAKALGIRQSSMAEVTAEVVGEAAAHPKK